MVCKAQFFFFFYCVIHHHLTPARHLSRTLHIFTNLTVTVKWVKSDELDLQVSSIEIALG